MYALCESVWSWRVSGKFVAEKNGADFWKLGAKGGLVHFVHRKHGCFVQYDENKRICENLLHTV